VCTSKMTIAEASTGRTRTIAVQSDHPRQLRLSGVIADNAVFKARPTM
jgi:hypothetical protein